MEQYISKSALAAEIEKRKKHHKEWLNWCIENRTSIIAASQSIQEDKDIMSLIDTLDTLEAKEVDLARENLTWKDIRELYIIFAEIDAEIEFCKTDIQGETIGYYQEALKRLKAQKGK